MRRGAAFLIELCALNQALRSCVSNFNSSGGAVLACTFVRTAASSNAPQPKPVRKKDRLPPVSVQQLIQFLGSSPLPKGLEMSLPASTLTAEDRESFSAFKQAEKAYHLHRELVYRNCKGKMKLSGMRITPTDFSKVIDLNNPESLAAHDHVRFAIPREEHQDASPSASPSEPQPVYHLRKYPGLFLLPGYLSAQEQMRLCKQYVEELCEPPSRTNHFLHYGYFEGLWKAYQASLPPREPRTDPDSAPSSSTGAPQSKGGFVPRSQMSGKARYLAQKGTEGVYRLSEACRNMDPNKSSQGPYSKPEQPGTPSPAQDDDRASPSAPAPSSSGRFQHETVPFDRAWAREGTGPTAEVVLRKIRWSTLGPQYDWDAREYDASIPHVPVPPVLTQMATRSVDAVRDTWELEHGQGSSGLPRRGVYSPDVALVNVYREGDTLNGHVDDVEKDMSLPIVTLSLGCDAVFLVGGQTKDIAPDAIMVRTGDVIIMGGSARVCYHGVPRILPENGVPRWLNPLTCEEEFRPVAEYFSQARINMSIRSTQEPSPERLNSKDDSLRDE